ncbi:MAG: SprB repeat-containing protein, partial [Bacteroidota bacterium]
MDQAIRTHVYVPLLLALFFSLGMGNLLAQAPYCAPLSGSHCQQGDQIENFSTSGGITNIVNNSSGCASGGYVFDSLQAITITAGDSFGITVQAGPSWAQGFAIWIDWNNDVDYEDGGELVWSSSSPSFSPFTGTIQVANDQVADTFRMRVRSSYNSVPSDPCTNQTYSEVEEYLVVVESRGPEIGICYGDIPPLIQEVDTASKESGPFTYLWQVSTDDTSWSTAPGSNTNFDYSPITNLFDTTFYRRLEIDQPTGDTAFSTSATILVPDSLQLTAALTAASCAGLDDGSIDLTVIGGAAPFSFNWSNGDSIEDLTSLAPGSYSVTVTDIYDCVATGTYVITETRPIQVSLAIDSLPSCFGISDGGLTATGSGGSAPYAYAWSNSATTASITGVLAGTYSVTATDANGCQVSDSSSLTQPALLSLTAVIDSNVSCQGFLDGGVTASVTGGSTPYAYLWSNNAPNASITGVGAGTYTVTVTDANGCTESDAETVSEPTAFSATAVVDSNASCNAIADGGLTAQGTGGTAPYTYLWSNGATTASITGILADAYSVTITDANGCTDQTSGIITEPAALSAFAVVDSNTSCFGFLDGGAAAAATGGTAPYAYSWSNSATTASITGVAAGTYSVTITDANGCVGNTSVQIAEPAALDAVAVLDSNASCFGFSDGGATASATGGTAPYSYAWSNSATTPSITGVIAGSYSVTITDANGCTDQTTQQIIEPTALLAATVLDSNISCKGLLDGGAMASATGGTAPYAYLWSTTASTNFITGVAAGTYTVTVTDANGCTDQAIQLITEPAELIATVAVDSQASCFGFADGGLTTNVTGGTAPYAYLWNNTAITASITGVTAGSYSVTIT